MLTPSRLLISVVALTLAATAASRAADGDLLDEVRKRQKVEAERVERLFADDRLAAYKLVRTDNPKLLESSEKLQALLALVREDTALEAKRREVLIVTLKADLERVQLIAAERRRGSPRIDAVARENRAASAKAESALRSESSRKLTDDARSIYDARAKAVADSRTERSKFGDSFAKTLGSVEDSAVPVARDYTLPKNWKELSEKRAEGQKLSAQEKAIMKALGKSIEVDYEKVTFNDVIDHLRKATGVEIIVDKTALTDVSASYESPISLKLRSSTRSVLKRVCADLGLAYVIKDEAIQITSQERANQMTTTRSYYIGDIASVVDVRLPPELTQLQMIENVNRLIAMITQSVDTKSWRVNNPDAVGAIYFDPLTMSLVVKQTAEVHYMIGGYK